MKIYLDDYTDAFGIAPIYVLTPKWKTPFGAEFYHNFFKWTNPDDVEDNSGVLFSEKCDRAGKAIKILSATDFLAAFWDEEDADWNYYDDEYPTFWENGIFVGEIETPEKKYCVLSFNMVIAELATILGQVLSYDEMRALTKKANNARELWEHLHIALENADTQQLAKLTGLSVKTFQPLTSKVKKFKKEMLV